MSGGMHLKNKTIVKELVAEGGIKYAICICLKFSQQYNILHMDAYAQYIVKEQNQNIGYFQGRRVGDVTRLGYKWAVMCKRRAEINSNRSLSELSIPGRATVKVSVGTREAAGDFWCYISSDRNQGGKGIWDQIMQDLEWPAERGGGVPQLVRASSLHQKGCGV